MSAPDRPTGDTRIIDILDSLGPVPPELDPQRFEDE